MSAPAKVQALEALIDAHALDLRLPRDPPAVSGVGR